jgi:hypothetical protein
MWSLASRQEQVLVIAPVSRRQFLLALLALSGASGNAWAIGSKAWDGLGVDDAKRWLAGLLFQAPPNANDSPLELGLIEVLNAGALALLAVPVESQNYADFLSRRAELLPGHRDLHRRAARMLDRTCRERFGKSFLLADPEKRLVVAKEVLIVEPEQGKLALVWRAISARERFLVDRHVGRPVLNLFEHTDLYRALGYPSWPGMPTGYEAYLRFLEAHVVT